MEIFEKSSDGVIYRVLTKTRTAGSVIVDLAYSYSGDYNYGLVEASVEPGDNPGLTPYDISEANQELERGLFREINQFLIEQYANTHITYTAEF